MNTMTPAELLASVDRWLWAWAHKAAGKIPGRFYDADDLHAEMAMKVLKFAHTYKTAKAKPTTWASYVCMSVIYTIQRKIFDTRHLAALNIDDDIPCEELSYSMPSDDERDDHDCVSRIADELLDILGEARRDAVVEKFYSANSFEDRPPLERREVGKWATSGIGMMRRRATTMAA